MVRYYLALAIAVVCNSASLILLKAGLDRNPGFSMNFRQPDVWIALIFHPFTLTGIFMFLLSFVTWMIALTRIDLSLAYPTSSISYLVIVLAGHLLYGEQITLNRLIGVSLIVAGIIVMYVKNR